MQQTIGPYRVVRELGRGGMGVVYEVQDPAAPRTLALKQVLGESADAEVLLRFARECELLARVRHPNVVLVHTTGRTATGPYLVSELVRGRSLTELGRESGAGASGAPSDPLEPRRAAELVRDIAGAVQALHGQGLLHRDLKPDNVIVRADGSPVLLDFGLAREMDGAQLTKSGALLGTPSYMAPEQVDARRDLDARVDVYGLGGLLYFLLAGRAPFAGHSVVEVLGAVLRRDPEWPSKRRPEIPLELEAICRRALAKERAGRYPSAAALRDDLERWLRGETPLAAERRSPAPLALAGLLGAVALAAGVAWALGAGRGSPAEPPVGVAPPSTLTGATPPPLPPQPGDDRAVVEFRTAWSQRGAAAPVQGGGLLATLCEPRPGSDVWTRATFLDDHTVLVAHALRAEPPIDGSTRRRVLAPGEVLRISPLRGGVVERLSAGVVHGPSAQAAPDDEWLRAIARLPRPGGDLLAIGGDTQTVALLGATTAPVERMLPDWTVPEPFVRRGGAEAHSVYGTAGAAPICDILALAGSRDGLRLAVGGDWREVWILDVTRAPAIRSTLVASAGERAVVEDLAFSPDGRRLAVVRSNRIQGEGLDATYTPWRIDVWDALATGELAAPLASFSKEQDARRPRHVVWVAPDILVVGHDGGQVISMRVAGARLETVDTVQVEPESPDALAEGNDILDLVATADGRTVHALCASRLPTPLDGGPRRISNRLTQFSVQDGRLLQRPRFEALPRLAHTLDVSPDGALLLVADEKGGVTLWGASR